ncbi:MAG: glycosyltransferase family 2 protein [Planctomycetes bacterium]|nr:glycosyltransferase family 2 protein [Planctomycetota bacterium]
MPEDADLGSPSATTSADVSVIVCTLDRPEPLAECLRAIWRQTVAPAEILVVTGSDASLPPGFAADFSEVRLVNAPGRNLSVSRNAGIREASCAIAAFCDDDAAPQRAWLQELLRPFSAPEVAAVGGTVYDAREVPARLDFVCGLIRPSGRQMRIRAPDIAGEARAPRGWFCNVCGCNFALRRQALLEIGGFDEFYEFAYEEADVAVRLFRAGWRVVHAPDAVVLHGMVPGGYREDDLINRNWHAEIKNQVYFGLKNGWGPAARPAVLARALARLVKLRLRWARAVREGQLAKAASGEYLRSARRGFLAGLRAGAFAKRKLPFARSR